VIRAILPKAQKATLREDDFPGLGRKLGVRFNPDCEGGINPA